MNWQRWVEALRAGAVDPDHVARYHGGGKSQPAPDYKGSAEAQAQSSKEVTNMQSYANRPDVNTPFGTQSWATEDVVDPATGQHVTKWTQNNALSPDAQAALDAQQDITMGRSQAAQTLLGQATEGFEQPFDWSSMPAVPGSLDEAQNKAYQTMSAALEPGRTQAREGLETRLANMGLPMGSEAYARAKQQLQDQFTQQDKTNLAAAMGEGRSDIQAQQGLRSAAIAEQAQKRGMSLNELNALLTGQQVSMPQMPGFTQAGAAQPTQFLDAAQAQGQYGLQQQQQQGAQTGQLIGTAAMVGAAMF